MTYTKKSRQTLRFERTSLMPSCAIVTNGVPATQDFNGDLNEYTPDFSLAPLTLQPVVTVLSGDATQPPVRVNNRLGNIVWKELKGRMLQVGESEDITSMTSGYDLAGCAEGSDTSGLLIVNKNFPAGTTTLEFNATLPDPLTGENHIICQRISVSVTASWCPPRVLLDTNAAHRFNPLRDAHVQTINAVLMLGSRVCPDDNRKFYWCVWNGSAWERLDRGILHYYADISSDGSQLTINRDLMGYGVKLRCSADYNRNGSPSTRLPIWVPPASLPSCEIAIKRIMPDIDILENSGFNIAEGAESVRLTTQVVDTQGVVQNPQEHFRVKWKVGTISANTSAGITMTDAGMAHASGSNGKMVADISTAKMNPVYGMATECEVEDLGPWLPWADSDGAILTDADGSILLIK